MAGTVAFCLHVLSPKAALSHHNIEAVDEAQPCAESCGMQEPLETRYLHPDAKQLRSLPEILFLLILTACTNLAFDRSLCMLVRGNRNAPDGGVLAVGLTMLLHQLPHSFLEVPPPLFFSVLSPRWSTLAVTECAHAFLTSNECPRDRDQQCVCGIRLWGGRGMAEVAEVDQNGIGKSVW